MATDATPDPADTMPDTGPPAVPPTAPPAPPTPDAPPADQADMAAEAAKWKELARKHEDRAKANAAAAKELEQLRQQTMTDTEKAIATAKAETRAEYEAKLAEAAIKVAAAGKFRNPADALLFVDRADLVFEDGIPTDASVDQAVTKVLTDKPYLAAQTTPPAPTFGNADGGPRGQSSPTQWTEADLARATPDQIVTARKAGQLVALGFNPKR